MSPKAPRNISGSDLIKLLKKFDYEVTRQKGSHVRLTRISETVTHHVTIPDHNPLKLVTLMAIIADVSGHLKISKDSLLNKL